MTFWAATLDVLTVALGALAAIIAATGGLRKVLFDDLRISLTDPWRPLLAGVAVCAIRHLVCRRPTLLGRVGAVWTWIARHAGRQPLAADEGVLLAGTPSRICRRGELLAVGAAMALLTILMTYPQIRRLDAVPDLGDPLFSTWRLAWVAHQLPRDPLHLFDGNMFYPERFTLAYSDSMLLPAVTAAPFLWLGVHTVVVYNAFLLMTFVLAGVSMYLLVRALTAQASAAFVAGVAFAFYPFRFDHYSHFELQWSFWMPLALLALHRTLARGRPKDGLLTGGLLACQTFSSIYFGTFLAIYLVPVWAVVGLGWRRVRSSLVPLAAGAVLAAALIVPAMVPYFQGRHTVGERTTEEIDTYSATGNDYLVPRVNGPTYTDLPHGRIWPERALFPGILIVVLALVGVWPPLSASRMAYAAGLVFAFEASLGLHGYLYPLLYRWLPPFHALRVAARFSMLVGFSLAVLAGYGVARVAGRIRVRWLRHGLAVALCAVVLFVSRWVQPLEAVYPAPGPVERWLAAQPPTVIVDLPVVDRVRSENAYLYFSTFHWQRRPNGFSGFLPPSYLAFLGAMAHFPDDEGMALLGGREVRFVVVHEQFYPRRGLYLGALSAIGRRSDLREVYRSVFGAFETRVYQLVR
jgi:hypothetical protein